MTDYSLYAALQIYEKLRKYLPKIENKSVSIIEFVYGIIENIKKKDGYTDYLDAFMLLTGLSEQEIEKLSGKQQLDLFISTLTDLSLFSLCGFCEDLGWPTK